MNYQRVVQWATGPVSAIIAGGATSLVHTTISHNAALNVSTFVLTAAATYLGHAKWASNLVAWWDHEAALAGAVRQPGDPVISPGAGFHFDPAPEPDAPPQRLVAEKLRAQLTDAGIAPRA